MSKNWQVGRFITFENATSIEADQSVRSPNVWSITHESTCFGVLAEWKNRRNSVPHRQSGELSPPIDKQGVGNNGESVGTVFDKVRKGAVDFSIRAGNKHLRLPTKGRARRMKFRDIGLRKSNCRIGQQRQPHGSGHKLAQEFKPFFADLDAHRADASDVSARPIQASYEPDSSRIRTRAEDDGNGRGQSFQS